MKKALVILYYWPPAGGSAVQRWLKFSKYLPEYGWQPVIYAPENAQYPETDVALQKEIPDNIEVIRQPILEPFRLYKKFVGIKPKDNLGASMTLKSELKGVKKIKNDFAFWIRSNFFIPDARFLWVRPSVKFLKSYLGKSKVDVIVTTGPPHSIHLIGLKLHQSLGTPWVADFRDPWTSIDFYYSLPLTRMADKMHHRLEAKVLKEATHIVAIGQNMKTEFQKAGVREISVITNGYDEADLITEDVTMDKRFSIVHLGTLSASRNSVALWRALASKAMENKQFKSDLEIHLLGRVDYSVFQEIADLNLTDNLNYKDFVPHQEGMKILKKAQVLLLLINKSVNAKGVITGKFFEYLASKRPILLIGPEDGDASEILRETESGLAAGFDDEAGIRKHLDTLYDRYLQNSLTVNSHSFNNYSRRMLTGKLAQVLDSIIRTNTE